MNTVLRCQSVSLCGSPKGTGPSYIRRTDRKPDRQTDRQHPHRDHHQRTLSHSAARSLRSSRTVIKSPTRSASLGMHCKATQFAVAATNQTARCAPVRSVCTGTDADDSRLPEAVTGLLHPGHRPSRNSNAPRRTRNFIIASPYRRGALSNETIRRSSVCLSVCLSQKRPV